MPAYQCGLLACRAIIHANKCLLFEPSSASSRKFLDLLCGRLHQESAQRHPQHTQSEDDIPDSIEEAKPPPFELEVLEAALMVATGAACPLPILCDQRKCQAIIFCMSLVLDIRVLPQAAGVGRSEAHE